MITQGWLLSGTWPPWSALLWVLCNFSLFISEVQWGTTFVIPIWVMAAGRDFSPFQAELDVLSNITALLSLLLDASLTLLPPTWWIDALRKLIGRHYVWETAGFRIPLSMLGFIDCLQPRSRSISAPSVTDLPIFRPALLLLFHGSLTGRTAASSLTVLRIWNCPWGRMRLIHPCSRFAGRRCGCTGCEDGRRRRLWLFRHPTVWHLWCSFQSPRVLLAHSRKVRRFFDYPSAQCSAAEVFRLSIRSLKTLHGPRQLLSYFMDCVVMRVNRRHACRRLSATSQWALRS